MSTPPRYDAVGDSPSDAEPPSSLAEVCQPPTTASTASMGTSSASPSAETAVLCPSGADMSEVAAIPAEGLGALPPVDPLSSTVGPGLEPGPIVSSALDSTTRVASPLPGSRGSSIRERTASSLSYASAAPSEERADESVPVPVAGVVAPPALDDPPVRRYSIAPPVSDVGVQTDILVTKRGELAGCFANLSSDIFRLSTCDYRWVSPFALPGPPLTVD